MIDPAFATNTALSERLRGLLEAGAAFEPAAAAAGVEFEVFTQPGASRDPRATADVVVTVNEINNQHGSGPLVKRLYEGRRNIFSIRTKNDWGDHDFGDWSVCIPQRDRPRPECYRRVISAVGNRAVGHVLCVPFHSDELITSIALRDAYRAKLAMYLMDDQNIAADTIPDGLMAEFLEKCDIRFLTHAELRLAYERKYGLRCYVLPAVAPHRYVITAPVTVTEQHTDPRRGTLIGSFWDQSWFDRTCNVLAGCDCRVDWYGNNKSPWLKFPAEDLERAGIDARGIVPEEELARRLREYPFVIVPAAALDEQERNVGVARLSLPGRILFAVAASNTPVLLLGSEETCGARFVRRLDVGEVAPYDSAAVSAAMARLARPEIQQRLRRNAARAAAGLSDAGIVEWLRTSIELGRPADDRFEKLFDGYDTAAVDRLNIQPYRPESRS